jgi:hypothetical protein
MMYCVRVTAFIPYPIVREYTKACSGFHVAIARAIKDYRADERIKGHKITRMTIQAVTASAGFTS